MCQSFLLHLFQLLLLSLDVILGKIAVLASSIGVMGTVCMTTCSSFNSLTLLVVAAVTHLFGVMTPVSVWAHHFLLLLSG